MPLAEMLDERETEYADRYDTADWRVMARLQSKAERHQRCAFDVSGRPCGARPDLGDPREELPALKRHVAQRHLDGADVEAAIARGAARHVTGTFAYLYYLDDGRLWCFAGSDREWADWMNADPIRAVEAPSAAPQYAF